MPSPTTCTQQRFLRLSLRSQAACCKLPGLKGGHGGIVASNGLSRPTSTASSLWVLQLDRDDGCPGQKSDCGSRGPGTHKHDVSLGATSRMTAASPPTAMRMTLPWTAMRRPAGSGSRRSSTCAFAVPVGQRRTGGPSSVS